MNRPVHGGNLAWAAKLAGCSPNAILDFSASINPLGPPQSAIAAIQSHLSVLTAYPDPDYFSLCLALSQVHQLPSEWIIPGNGAAELLTWAGRDLSNLAVTCLVTPAFGDYWRSLKAFNATVLKCPLGLETGEFHIPKSLDLSSSGLLINNPHNPTGKLFSREAILPYLDQFALVVVDEAFMDFLPPDEEQSLIGMVQNYPNLVVVRSLTKFYSLPGLRLGYAIAHPDRIKRWQQWRDPWSVNTLAVAAGVAVLQDREFQQRTLDWLKPAKDKLFRGLTALPGLHPYESAANFLLVQSTQPSSLLQEKLLKHSKILIRDCLSFPELGDRFFRVAVRSPEENQRLLEGLASEQFTVDS